MADYNKIYPALDPSAPLDKGAFNKSRVSALTNKITEIETEVTKKLICEGISHDEFARLQKIFYDLLRNLNSKLYRTDALVKDLKQEDFFQNMSTMFAKK